jgi:hypothetical protein
MEIMEITNTGGTIVRTVFANNTVPAPLDDPSSLLRFRFLLTMFGS